MSVRSFDPTFRVRGGELVHLVSLVYLVPLVSLVWLIQGTREIR